MHRRLLSATAIGALLLGLAACGDPNDGPVTTPPPDLGIEAPSDGGGDPGTSDDSGGQSDGGGDDAPTADTPAIPAPDPADFAGMDEHTAEGAEQAFRYYIATAMWAHQVGDDSATSALQTDDCESCAAFMETYQELQDHDATWGQFDLSEVTLWSQESENYEYEVRYDFRTTPHKRPKDDFTGTVDVGRLGYSTVGGLTWSNGKWLVGGVSADWGNDVLPAS